jgi:hypothetical protein
MGEGAMIRRIALAGLMVIALLVGGVVAVAAPVDVEVLLADPQAFQGEVTLTGELVGDYGWRGDGWVWAQLNDDPYAEQPILEDGPLSGGNVGVGIRMPHDLAEQLGPPGGYRRRGPVVAATGTWVYHDESRGGESYLEVVSLVLIEPGRDLSEDPSWLRLAGGAALLGAAAALWMTRAREEV